MAFTGSEPDGYFTSIDAEPAGEETADRNSDPQRTSASETKKGSSVRPRRTRRDPVTLEEVGERAGVSKSTVSRVMNGLPGVSKAAFEAVIEAVTELGYVPNRTAKSLASRKASAVTALIPEDMWRIFGDPYFGSIMSGVEAEIQPTELVLTVAVTSEGSLAKTISYLAGGQSDGILVLSHHNSHRIIEALESRIPIVYGGRPWGDTSGKTYVDVDNVSAAAEAAQYLVDRGCERIAMITGPGDMPSASDRQEGFLSVVEPAGRLGPIESGDYSALSGGLAAHLLLERDEPFDGLFAANDLMARAAIDVLLAAGRSVPEDVAVVGFDDSIAATSAHPELTTVRQDPELQGRWMARLLLEQLDGVGGPKAMTLPTQMIVRESA